MVCLTSPEALQIHLRRNWKHFIQQTVVDVDGQPGVAQKIPSLLRLQVLHHDVADKPGREKQKKKPKSKNQEDQ